jgi:hypothetical protein
VLGTSRESLSRRKLAAPFYGAEAGSGLRQTAPGSLGRCGDEAQQLPIRVTHGDLLGGVTLG